MVMAVRDLLGAFPALLSPCRRHPGAIGPDSEGSEQGVESQCISKHTTIHKVKIVEA